MGPIDPRFADWQILGCRRSDCARFGLAKSLIPRQLIAGAAPRSGPRFASHRAEEDMDTNSGEPTRASNWTLATGTTPGRRVR